LAALVYGLDGLDSEDQQVVQGTRAALTALNQAFRADSLLDPFKVGIDTRAFGAVHGIYIPAQVHFYAAILAQRPTGRPAWRPLDAPTANLLSDFVKVFLEFQIRDHDFLAPLAGHHTTPHFS
jgi:hypothetical protein